MARRDAENEQLLIDRWLHGKSERTQGEYRRDVDQFRCFIGKPLVVCTLDDLQDWQDELGLSIQQSSVRRKLAAVKSLLTFAQETGIHRFNVGVALKLPKVRDTLADRILSHADLEKMIRLERNRRNRLLLRTLYVTGIRVSELCQLKWRDLKKQRRGAVLNVFGKGGKTRAIWMPSDLLEALLAYRGESRPSDPMFPSDRSCGHLSKQRVRNIVRHAAEVAGIEGDVSPHWLRHTHASEALHNGAPIDLVSKTLGHSSLAVTSRYVHASPTESSAQYLPSEREEETS